MFNKVVLVGRTTRDIELKKTTSGTSVASFTLAMDNRYVLKDGKPSTDFINCVAWNNTAETMGRYVTKGSMILVEGRLQNRSYDNKDGNKVTVTEVVVNNMQMLDTKRNGSSSNNYDGYEPASSYSEKDDTVDTPVDVNEYNISDDDLPF